MKQLFNPYSSSNVRDFAFLLLRIIVGLLLITHGYPKLQKLLSGNEIQFASVFGMSQKLSLAMAMFAEFFCAIFLLIGLFTRLAAVPIIITFLVIVFQIHGSDPLGQKELPIMYLISCITIFLCGPGKFSLDYLIYSKAKR